MTRIPITLQLVVLTLGLTGLYTMVGQTVPQKESHPPEVIEIAQDVTPDEMAEIGKGIFEGKGICNTCHTVGKSGALRYPDLEGIATHSATRIADYSALDYLAETFYEPDVYIVDGFASGMPAINKPPIGLTDGEILTVVAYLQTLGGTATVTMDTQHAYNGGTLGGGGGGTAGGEAVLAAADDDTLLAAHGCTSCHATASPEATPEGPSLYDVGSRLDRDALLSETIYHEGTDVLTQVTQAELQALVAEMGEMKGQG